MLDPFAMPAVLLTSVVDPDPKDPLNFAGSGSIIFSMDPDPDLDLDLDLNQAHFTLPPLLLSSFTLNLSPLIPPLPHLPHPSPLLAYLSPAHHISPPSSLTRPRSPQFSHPGPSSLIHHLSSLTPSP